MIIFNIPVTENDISLDVRRLEALIEGMASGEQNALSEFYTLTKSSVYGFALSILKNSHDAEDAMHNCYLAVWQNAEAYKPHGKPMAWVLTVVKNLCYMKLRDGKRTTELNPAGMPEIAAADSTASTAEDKAVIDTALRILSDDERQIVMLHAVSGLKFREIASLLGMLTATVLSKYNRALKKMRKALEEEKQ